MQTVVLLGMNRLVRCFCVQALRCLPIRMVVSVEIDHSLGVDFAHGAAGLAQGQAMRRLQLDGAWAKAPPRLSLEAEASLRISRIVSSCFTRW